MDREQLRGWLEGYERAWRTPGTDALAELFTENATYSTAPYETPHRGLAAIGEMWEAERSGPDEDFEMSSDVVAVESDTGVVRVEVRYSALEERGQRRHRQQPDYRDIWIVRLNEAGLCFHFEEWPFWPSDQEGAPTGAPSPERGEPDAGHCLHGRGAGRALRLGPLRGGAPDAEAH